MKLTAVSGETADSFEYSYEITGAEKFITGHMV